MKALQAVAVDIDGVLVADTFSPVIRLVVERLGGVYDREIERNVFSQNRFQAARYLLDRLGSSLSEQELLDLYFQTRGQWIAEHGGGLNPGVEAFLATLERAGLRLVCYGGLPESHFQRELGPWATRFETYVCTDEFRPGVAEIVSNVLRLPPADTLFIDDVSRVAEAAREQGCAFVGMPASFSWGHQRRDMEAVGVPFLIESLSDLTPNFLDQVDSRAFQGYWP